MSEHLSSHSKGIYGNGDNATPTDTPQPVDPIDVSCGAFMEVTTDPMAAVRQTLAEMRATHRQAWASVSDETWGGKGFCDWDGHPWPCDASRLLDALDGVVELAEEWGAAVGNTSTGPATLYVHEAHDRLRAVLAGIGGAR